MAAQREPHYWLLCVTQALSQEQARLYDLDTSFPQGMQDIKPVVVTPSFPAEWETVRIFFTGTAELLR